MATDEIVDPTIAPSDQFRRFLFHIGIPVAGVVSVIAVIAGVGWHSYRTVRTGALTLTHDLLVSQQDYVAKEVSSFLMPASAGAIVARDMLEHGAPEVEQKIFTGYSSTMMRNVPQIQSFYIADSDGNFSTLEHGEKQGETALTTLHGVGTPQAIFTHELRDDNGKLLKQWQTPAGTYDPRGHGWFADTVKAGQEFWTRPYMVEVTKQVTITAAVPYKGSNDKTYVYAINMSLNHLNSFLNSLKIGESGTAILLDQDGHVVAGHGMQETQTKAHGDPSKMTLDPEKFPVMTKAFDEYRVHGYGARTVRVKGRQYVTITANLPVGKDSWVLLLVAPEDDFSRFAMADGRQNLLFFVLVVIMALGFGLLLFLQARRSDRLRNRIRQSEAVANYESHALQSVAAYPDLFNPEDNALVLTETLADQSHARRAAIWRILHDGHTLMCIDSYDRQQDVHSGGFEMATTDLKKFFDAVSHGDALVATNASTDDRTTAFYRVYMRAFGSSSLFCSPIQGSSGPVGVITLEDAPRAEMVSHFVDMIAGVAAARFSAQHYTAVAAAREELESEPAAGEEEPQDPSQGFLLSPGALSINGQAGSVDLTKLDGFYPAVTIMVISLSDMIMTAQNDPAANIKLIDTMAGTLQDIAHQCGLYSIRMLGHRVVCVAGCSRTPDKGAVFRMANAALMMRENVLAMLSQADLDPVFRIGIDVGPVFGGMLGKNPQAFNLWGDAMGMAEMMAQGAPDVGTIQVSENVYQRLRQYFLFRERGRFFIPGMGLTRTYVLAGRR
ncbi:MULTISPECIES: adenylate/guanylate cyclase domain-containing protein [Komagataeibacter]|uniref:Two component hybrid sensor histidine kinase and transcriptional regulator/adenylate/guanylate cyclase n=2 Tax=Komagataeibacter TaxID=1434011 RepID=A0A0D6Q4D4_KOMXY|nr:MULTISPECIES: adenylate/guanylate cyclase domain-containing protein [Komagataeibacter]MBL7232826.1 adenylate/guanylate cyclase domain-containing protein [Komagataeibacter oboediens]MBT0675569.1 adenylate/guanylate cyclase domain-containing protein [Komagataeibacter oboediens]MBT0679062.1 adenylate/guanylate cyclase domain-containing protein [Komagataeibacter oboediens]MBV0889025.1 adenylate/guanylate cyclase domain-containing protein [Komagataeibacter oboediens]MBV1823303.1 adenylate/guanyl